MKNKYILVILSFLITACASPKNVLVLYRNKQPYEIWRKVKDCIYESEISPNIFLPSEYGEIVNGAITLPGVDAFALPIDSATKSWSFAGARFRFIEDKKIIPEQLKLFPITVVEMVKMRNGVVFTNHIYLRDHVNVVGFKSLNSNNLVLSETYPLNFYRCSKIERVLKFRSN